MSDPQQVRERLMVNALKALSKHDTEQACKLIEGYEKLVRAEAVDHTIKEDSRGVRQEQARQTGPEQRKARAVQE
jgi:hypothetical protein